MNADVAMCTYLQTYVGCIHWTFSLILSSLLFVAPAFPFYTLVYIHRVDLSEIFIYACILCYCHSLKLFANPSYSTPHTYTIAHRQEWNNYRKIYVIKTTKLYERNNTWTTANTYVRFEIRFINVIRYHFWCWPFVVSMSSIVPVLHRKSMRCHFKSKLLA